MANLEYQLYHALYLFLTSTPIKILTNFPFFIGLVTGVLSILPYGIGKFPIVVMGTVALLFWVYTSYSLEVTVSSLIYEQKAYWIVNFFGNFIIGNILGLIISNVIQRLRGEHEKQ